MEEYGRGEAERRDRESKFRNELEAAIVAAAAATHPRNVREREIDEAQAMVA